MEHNRGTFLTFKAGARLPDSPIVNQQARRSVTMTWHCISGGLHSEDVTPVSRMLVARAVLAPEMIRRCLPTWDEESVCAVIREVERLMAKGDRAQ